MLEGAQVEAMTHLEALQKLFGGEWSVETVSMIDAHSSFAKGLPPERISQHALTMARRDS